MSAVIWIIVIRELALNTQTLRYAYALALCAPVAFNIVIVPTAWSEDGDESLDEVVVVANRAPEPLSKVGNSVTVLDQQAIQDSQKVDMSELLATTPGITFSRNGGPGNTTSVYIRGANSDHTVVLHRRRGIERPFLDRRQFRFRESAGRRYLAHRDSARRAVHPLWQSGDRRRDQYHHHRAAAGARR